MMPLAEPGPGEPLVGATSVIGDHIEDGERDPHTIAEEQRRRSALYEAGASMEEVATTDLPDAPRETRRVAPPQQQPARRDEPHHAANARQPFEAVTWPFKTFGVDTIPIAAGLPTIRRAFQWQNDIDLPGQFKGGGAGFGPGGFQGSPRLTAPASGPPPGISLSANPHGDGPAAINPDEVIPPT